MEEREGISSGGGIRKEGKNKIPGGREDKSSI